MQERYKIISTHSFFNWDHLSYARYLLLWWHFSGPRKQGINNVYKSLTKTNYLYDIIFNTFLLTLFLYITGIMVHWLIYYSYTFVNSDCLESSLWIINYCKCDITFLGTSQICWLKLLSLCEWIQVEVSVSITVNPSSHTTNLYYTAIIVRALRLAAKRTLFSCNDSALLARCPCTTFV